MQEKHEGKQPPKYNKDKIILMAKLAVYDKHNGKNDHKDDEYFRQDYIYSNNMRTRFYAFFGCIILAVFYFLHIASYQETDIFSIDYLSEAIRVGIFFTVVLVGYTFIGTILYTARHVQLQKRLDEYYGLLSKLDSNPEAQEEDREKDEEESRSKRQDGDDEMPGSKLSPEDGDEYSDEDDDYDDEDDYVSVRPKPANDIDDDDFIDYLAPFRSVDKDEETEDKDELDERL